jgi:hypothetical protein
MVIPRKKAPAGFDADAIREKYSVKVDIWLGKPFRPVNGTGANADES